MGPATWSGTFKFPIYYGDPEKHPQETWQGYEESIRLAYLSSGIGDGLTDEVKRAHLLYGLEGKAKKERELHSEWLDMPLDELQRVLRSTFNKPRWRDLTGIGNIVQKLDESCREYASRLKAAIRAFAPETEYTAVSKKESRQVEGEEVVTVKDISKETEAYHKVTDRLLLNYFIQNMRIDLKKVVVAARPRTMTEALDIAEAHEQYVEMLGGFKHVHLTTAGPGRALNLQVEPAVATASRQLTEMNNRPYHTTAAWKQRTSGRGGDDRQDGEPNGQANFRCFACNKPGHFQRECPEQDGTDIPNVRCYECEQPGHFRRECPFRTDSSPEEYPCHFCGKKGHFEKECYSKARQQEQQKRKNIWATERKTSRTSPSPRRPMSGVRSSGPKAGPADPRGGASRPTAGRSRGSPNGNRSKSTRNPHRDPDSAQSKNELRGGRRMVIPQKTPRPFSKLRRPAVRWQE